MLYVRDGSVDLTAIDVLVIRSPYVEQTFAVMPL